MEIKGQWGVAVVLAVIAFVLGGEVAGQTTARVSVDSAGVQGNGISVGPSLSADGSRVAFVSLSNQLVPGDTNGRTDVFVHDRVSGTTIRASVSSSGTQGNADCSTASISGDGLHVAFASPSSTLVPGDTNSSSDIFVHDIASAVTTRVSVDSSGTAGNGNSYWPSISDDGRYVAFSSFATNLVAGDANGVEDVFVRDLQLGVTVRASVFTSGAEYTQPSSQPSISADGRYVAFKNGLFEDIRVRDLLNGTTVLAANCSAGFPPGCDAPSISADGRYVAYSTYGAHVLDDTNQSRDIFVRDMQSGVTIRASVDSFGREANDSSLEHALSRDGRCVVFNSAATNLVPPSFTNYVDTFVRDLVHGVTTRVNVDSAGTPANGGPGNPSNSLPAISGDGRVAAFYSGGTNLVPGDTNGVTDVFVRDWQQPDTVVTCLGDGSAGACPCGNVGFSGHGCDNSQATGGSQLSTRGMRRLSEDTFVLTAAGELPSVLSVFFQGNASVGPVNYGDGLRCIGGSLKRLYVKNAVAGIASAPAASDPSVSARSAALGDAITAGTTRWYQVFYRDPNPTFCPNPPGNTWNISSGIEASWGF